MTIPAGQTSEKVAVQTFDDDKEDGNKTLKVKLVPSTNDGYLVGSPSQLQLRILDVDDN